MQDIPPPQFPMPKKLHHVTLNYLESARNERNSGDEGKKAINAYTNMNLLDFRKLKAVRNTVAKMILDISP